MRTPPAIDVPVGDGACWRVAAALLAAAAAGVPLAWAGWHLQAAGWPGGLPMPALAGLAAAGAAAASWRARLPRARLRWTGTCWHWLPSGGPPRPFVSLRVSLDLGGALLLHAREETGAGRWLALDRRSAGPAWHPLRVAVMAGGRA
ncbi:hypothetical protein [Ideonella sp.]|uniref:hypothetical protein n=1 Tax=Ideonella sp. TaxID=1929293 RepID=UPI0035ADD3BB